MPMKGVSPRRLVSYDRQTLETPNPLARFAHQRRMMVAVFEAVSSLPSGGTVVDFGCGPGCHFLTMIGVRRPDVHLVGYDPYAADQRASGVRIVQDLNDLDANSVDCFAALETCEHLYEPELAQLLVHTRRLLRQTGTLLISVPIIAGPVLLAKEANRVVLHRRWTDYTLRQLVAAAFLGRPAPRAANVKTRTRVSTFAHCTLGSRRNCTAECWTNPFPLLPWYLNSQAFSTWAVEIRGG